MAHEARIMTEGGVNARAGHITCVSCGYDLFGLANEVVCPECSRPVRESLRRDRLFFARPYVLWAIVLACTLTLLDFGWLTLAPLLASFVGLGALNISWGPGVWLVRFAGVPEILLCGAYIVCARPLLSRTGAAVLIMLAVAIPLWTQTLSGAPAAAYSSRLPVVGVSYAVAVGAAGGAVEAGGYVVVAALLRRARSLWGYRIALVGAAGSVAMTVLTASMLRQQVPIFVFALPIAFRFLRPVIMAKCLISTLAVLGERRRMARHRLP